MANSKINTLEEVKVWLEPWQKTPPTTPQTVYASQFGASYVLYLFGLLFPEENPVQRKIELANIKVSFIEENKILTKCILAGKSTQPFMSDELFEPVEIIFSQGANGECVCSINTAISNFDWTPMSDLGYNLSITDLDVHYEPVLPDELHYSTESNFEAIYNMVFSGSAQIGTLALPKTTIQVPCSAGSWNLLIEPKISISSEQLQSVFDGHNIIEMLLVDYFEVQNFSFDRLYIVFNPNDTVSCHLIQASLSYNTDWSLLDGKFIVRELDFSFSLFNPFPGPASALQALILAKMTIVDTEVEVKAVFNRNLALSSTSISLFTNILAVNFSIAEVFKSFHITLPESFSSLKILISQIEFSLFPIEKKASINLTVNNPTLIAGNISLENFYFELHADFSKSSAEARGSMYANFKLGNTSLLLQGEYGSDAWSLGCRFGDLKLREVVQELSALFGFNENEVPSVIMDMEFKVLATSFSKSVDASLFEFSLEGTTHLAGLKIDFAPAFKLSNRAGNSWKIEFAGSLCLIDESTGDSYRFKITIKDKEIAADYDGPSDAFSLNTLCAIFNIAPPPEELNVHFNSIHFEYNYAEPQSLYLNAESEKYDVYIFAFEKKEKWIYVLGLNLRLNINFNGLPLIGNIVGPKFENIEIHLAYASDVLLKSDIHKLDPKLGIPSDSNGLAKGFSFLAKITLKNPKELFELRSNLSSNPKGVSLHGAEQMESSTTGQKDIGKTFGPINFESISMNFKDGRLIFDFNVSLVFSGISLAFSGLKISNPITKFEPEFGLDGLGLNYSKNNVELGGAFLRVKTNTKEEYLGLINIGLTKLKLSAMGIYSEVNSEPSFFLYGVLNFPIGGPAFFFVTGLAAAIGYNRNLILPAVDAVKEFPLVSAAIAPPASQIPSRESTLAMLGKLGNSVPAAPGVKFFGIGVKFNSFKVIDSFALLVVKLEDEVEVNLLGFSRYVAPAPQDPNPVAVVELGVVGQFIPSKGYVYAQAQLTPASYLFSKDCHLSGGFAFAAWTSGSHAGDFVYTFGGFGNQFQPPSHYPQNVPQLELLWKVDSHVTVKGGGYWAVTPQLVTAGGYLHASYNSSHLKAWFNLDAYFLISWKPFYYKAYFHVNIGVSVKLDLLVYSKWLSVDISVEMFICGPPFSGWASIDLSIISFTIHFGASPQPAKKIGWNDFERLFLPEKKETILQFNVANGLVSTVLENTTEWFIINAKEMEIQVQSIIPASDCSLNYEGKTIEVSGNAAAKKTGITPMDLRVDGYDSTLKLSIKSLEGQLECQLDAKIVLENAPSAIWGNGFASINDSKKLIHDTRKGILVLAKPATAIEPNKIDRDKLAWEWETFNNAFKWENLDKLFDTKKTSATIPFANPESGANARRTELLNAFNISNQDLTSADVSFDQALALGKYVL